MLDCIFRSLRRKNPFSGVGCTLIQETKQERLAILCRGLHIKNARLVGPTFSAFSSKSVLQMWVSLSISDAEAEI